MQILNKNPNEEIIVDDFINSYLLLEEKIKKNHTKYEKAQDELKEEISRNQEGLNNMKDEIVKGDITDQSKLFVTVIEANDLLCDSFISESSPSVTLSFQNEVKETKIKKNTTNPEWYESFKFPITSSEGALRLEVFDNSLMGKKSIGFLSMDLTDLMDQKKRLQWFDLYNKNHTNCGKIYLKIQAIINFRQYYEEEIKNAEKKISIIQNAFNLTNYYLSYMKNNFGVLFAEDLENLIDNQTFQQVDELINILEKNKESIYHKKDNNFTESNVFRSTNKGGKIILNTLTKVIIYCLIIFSFISLLERSDYIDLIIAILTFYFFILDHSGAIVDYLKLFLWIILGTIFFDCIWFIINFGGYFIGEKGDPESKLKRIIYLVAVSCTLIKCFFAFALYKIKRKKIVSNDSQGDEMK